MPRPAQVQNPGMPSIFSRIIAGEIPGEIVLATPRWVALLDINPVNPGHVLLIPRREVQHLDQLPEEELSELGPLAARLGRMVKAATGAPAINLIVNDGPAAGQEVPHVHLHLIPRHPGDGKRAWAGGGTATREELAAMAARLRAAGMP